MMPDDELIAHPKVKAIRRHIQAANKALVELTAESGHPLQIYTDDSCVYLLSLASDAEKRPIPLGQPGGCIVADLCIGKWDGGGW